MRSAGGSLQLGRPPTVSVKELQTQGLPPPHPRSAHQSRCATRLQIGRGGENPIRPQAVLPASPEPSPPHSGFPSNACCCQSAAGGSRNSISAAGVSQRADARLLYSARWLTPAAVKECRDHPLRVSAAGAIRGEARERRWSLRRRGEPRVATATGARWGSPLRPQYQTTAAQRLSRF